MAGLHKDAALINGLVDYTGRTVTEVARKASVDPETLRKPLNGKTENRLSQRTIEKLQSTYPGFPGWTKLADQRSPYRHQETAIDRPVLKPDDGLDIPMLELAYGMGGTFLDDVDPGETIQRFPRAFVRMFTNAPAEQLVFSHGIGDSMEPTIGDRDLLLIDRSRDTIRMNDQIWVLASGGIGMVKRVRIDSGEILLLSDNQNVPDQRAAEDDLTIIGRVVAIVKRI